MAEVLGSEFWIAQWRRAADGSRFFDVYPDERRIWDIFAASPEYDTDDGGRARALLKALDGMGFFTGGKRALDIGSGTGTLTLPLARRGVTVDALDSSRGMNRVLREKCVSAGIGGVNILTEDFNRYEGPEGGYDLVIGSLNPCLYNPESFLKMLALSRDVVAFIGVADPGAGAMSGKKSPVERLYGKSPGHNGSNRVLYPFNLLLSMGLCPAVDYVPGGGGTVGIVTCRK